MNRKEILDQALRELNREDKAEFLPTWLAGTEFRINNGLRDERMVKHAMLPITERIFPLPDNFVAHKPVLSIRSGNDPSNPGPVLNTLRYMPPDQVNDGFALPSYPEVRGPGWFTIRGRSIELGNWNLDSLYMVDMWYYAKIPPLAVDSDSNWLTDEAPHIYVEGIKHFGFRQLQEVQSSQDCLVTMTAEIQFLNQKNEELLTPQGPLIQRGTVGFGSNVRRRR